MGIKFNLDINGVGKGVAEGREAWSGDLPPTGSYNGVLKIMTVDVISDNSEKWAGRTKFNIGVELRNTPGGAYDGYVAWGNLNMIDPSIVFINQFLLALTDGSQQQQNAIEKAFYEGGLQVDKDQQKHVEKIGRWIVNSPQGELPIKVALVNKAFTNTKVSPPVTTQSVRISSFLLGGGAGPSGGNGSNGSSGGIQDIPEEEDIVELDADESILDV